MDQLVDQERQTNLSADKAVGAFSWRGITVMVKDRQTKKSVDLISDIYGAAKKGIFDKAKEMHLTNSYR